MAKSTNTAAATSTVMVLEKVCKSCVRFKSDVTNEEVSQNIYILNAAYEKLGKPKRINLNISSAD